MEPLYNIYYAGELLPGHELATTREQLGKLFKAGDETLDKLFSGKPQLLKRECDKATAVKYQQAMEKAGAKPTIKAAHSAEQTAPSASPASAPPPAQGKAQTAAERIAALAAAPDLQQYKSDDTGSDSPGPNDSREPNDSTGHNARQDSPTENASTLDIEAPGADVLKPEERAKPVETDIDTSALDLDLSGERLSEEPPPPPSAPDTSSLSMGEVGEDIPTLAPTDQPLDPDTSGIDLSPEGTDFSDCAPPEPEPVNVDLSSMDMAPAGSDVIEEKYRKKEKVKAPDTGHISLEE